MRRIQGSKRFTGIADDARSGYRFQYAFLPCGVRGIVVAVGAARQWFGKTRRFRREVVMRRENHRNTLGCHENFSLYSK
ncbi:MAG: hypothetical protein MJE77_19160 [Proteobacteria bacterium]|nr:hypothetical protein [Pseudomonadota bacterium]